MKKPLILAALSLTALPLWAGVGKNNFLMSVNVGVGIYGEYSDGPLVPKGAGYLGFDIGYLYHAVRPSGIINGMDLRAGILGDIPTGGYSHIPLGDISNPMILNFAINYISGYQFKNFRLFVDVIGIGAGVTFAYFHDAGRMDWGVGAQIPLPLGMHFLWKNGAYLSLRHHLVLNSYAANRLEGVIKYALLFSVGYAIGK